jgi:hypothetical protein
MLKHPNKILYIGAGYNIKSVKHFSQTKEFIFVDSQPRIKNENLHLETKFNKKEYVSDFVNNLLLSCRYNGFELVLTKVLDKKYHTKIISKKNRFISWFKKGPENINPTMLVFINKNAQQKIIYYISTNINLNINPKLCYDIASSDAIIVSDYFSEINILEYFNNTKIFIGYSNINYNDRINNIPAQRDLLFFLHNYHCNRLYFFSEFYMVDYETGIISKYEDFDKFLNFNSTYFEDK